MRQEVSGSDEMSDHLPLHGRREVPRLESFDNVKEELVDDATVPNMQCKVAFPCLARVVSNWC